MKLCAHCNAQFSDDFTRCIHCDRKLREDPMAATLAPSAETVLLAKPEPIFAAPLLDALVAAGIPFQLRPDGGTRRVNAYRGSSGHRARIEIFVSPERLDDARSVEAELLSRTLPDLPNDYNPISHPEDSCPACGYPIQSSQNECSDCGLAFPNAET